eukprot:scaffold38321_cov35-Tisochrysis_lutea.AAC.3
MPGLADSVTAAPPQLAGWRISLAMRTVARAVHIPISDRSTERQGPHLACPRSLSSTAESQSVPAIQLLKDRLAHKRFQGTLGAAVLAELLVKLSPKCGATLILALLLAMVGAALGATLGPPLVPALDHAHIAGRLAAYLAARFTGLCVPRGLARQHQAMQTVRTAGRVHSRVEQFPIIFAPGDIHVHVRNRGNGHRRPARREDHERELLLSGGVDGVRDEPATGRGDKSGDTAHYSHKGDARVEKLRVVIRTVPTAQVLWIRPKLPQRGVLEPCHIGAAVPDQLSSILLSGAVSLEPLVELLCCGAPTGSALHDLLGVGVLRRHVSQVGFTLPVSKKPELINKLSRRGEERRSDHTLEAALLGAVDDACGEGRWRAWRRQPADAEQPEHSRAETGGRERGRGRRGGGEAQALSCVGGSEGREVETRLYSPTSRVEAARQSFIVVLV